MSLLISLLGTFVTTPNIDQPNTYQAMRAASCWEFHNLLYKDPGLDKSSACVPLSATRPLSKTNILSQLTTVERRWAITIDVRPSVALSNALMILFSVMESRDEVASSKTKGPFINYVSTFFYQPQHFHEFLSIFEVQKKFKLRDENFVKM